MTHNNFIRVHKGGNNAGRHKATGKREDQSMMYASNRTTCPSTDLILVVASDLDLAFILAMILREEISHEVLVVADGKEAIDFCHLITPQLVLLDEHLPGIHALTVYKRLCQSFADRQIPGLLLGTSHPQDGSDLQNLYWIKKPFHWDNLLQTVKTLLDAS
jgi:DNA-binding response OmpR family regulator